MAPSHGWHRQGSGITKNLTSSPSTLKQMAQKTFRPEKATQFEPLDGSTLPKHPIEWHLNGSTHRESPVQSPQYGSNLHQPPQTAPTMARSHKIALAIGVRMARNFRKARQRIQRRLLWSTNHRVVLGLCRRELCFLLRRGQ